MDRAPTTRRVRRRVTRGDFGPVIEGSGVYPRNSAYAALREISDELARVPGCGDDAAVEAAELEPGLRAALAGVRRDDRCQVAFRHLADRFLRERRAKDRRSLTSPPFGSPPSPRFAALGRLEKAKVHLDRARQMYLAGKGLIARGIETGTAWMVSRGSAMQWQADVQTPRVGKKSALLELYRAYCLIRSYEVDPPPPLVRAAPSGDAVPNPVRLREDSMYEFLMGTMRLSPNRLGIGEEARRAWRGREGALDPNYYGDGGDAYSRLYADVPPNAPRGPGRVTALLGYIEDAGSRRGLPPSDALADLGYPNRAVVTDVGHALADLHAHFVPPLQDMGYGGERSPYDPPPPLRYPSCAPLGGPYPPGTWPFGDRIPEAVPQIDPSTLVPVFFPSGLSYVALLPGLSESQRRRLGPLPPFVQQEGPSPELGEPDPAVDYVWDARVSASMLCSETRRLQDQAIREQKLARALRAAEMGSEEPTWTPPPDPLRYWPEGKYVWRTDVRIAPQTFPLRSQTVFLGNRPPPQDREPEERSLPARRLLPRYLGADTAIRVGELALANTPSHARASLTDVLRPFGAMRYDVPEITDLGLLPPDAETQGRMLQHALFLLSAPLNSWQQEHLPRRLWLSAPPPASAGPGSPSYGDNAPGEGFYGRTDENIVDPDRTGWRGYLNPFSLTPTGGIRGRRRADGSDSAQSGLRTNGLPIGPLWLDPDFGNGVAHTPGSGYGGEGGRIRVWVIRTNQMTVLDQNTWGLDFYAAPALAL